jgi:hypothetical protein
VKNFIIYWTLMGGVSQTPSPQDEESSLVTSLLNAYSIHLLLPISSVSSRRKFYIMATKWLTDQRLVDGDVNYYFL